ncbi:MAG: NAD(P)-dependent oxidoreductase [Sedimenticola sp.]
MNLFVTLPDLDPEALKVLQELFDCVDCATERTSEENQLIDIASKYDAIIIGAKEKMSEKVYNSSTKLKIIGTLSSGTDHICDNFKNDDEKVILRCATSNVISVAEHTLMMMLVHTKRFRQGEHLLKEGKGRTDLRPLPLDLYQKTVGIIGLGPIGTRVTQLASKIGMKTLVHTRNPSNHQELLEEGAIFTSLNDLLEKSDITTIHLPLTEATKSFLNKDNIPLLKENAMLINTSRADIVDNSFLMKHIESEKDIFYAIDVEWGEITDDLMGKLIDNDSVYMSPHVAGLSRDAMFRMDTDLAAEFKVLLQ